MHYKILLLLTVVIFCIQADSDKSVMVDIYPGFGWDNLRFIDMTPIFDVSNFNKSNKFQSCIEVIPVRRTKIELGSTVIDMFDSRTKDYSSNLFVGGSAGYMGFRIGGSFSNEYQISKKEQGEEKTITLRNQIDYIMYDVILTSSCQLNPQVKKDLIEIAQYQTSEQSAMATYAAQNFVKKYGTHVTSRLSLGGSIMQEDFIKASAYYKEITEKRSYHVAAEASFCGTFSISSKFSSSSSTSDSDSTEIKKSFTRKIISSKGGKLSLSNGSMESWESSIDSLPVIVRRGIENITSFIQSDKIPELSEVELLNVREELNEAVGTYIQMNAYSGCMDRSSESFNWVANVDDGACKPSEENSRFGGFIRTCTENSRLDQKCGSYRMPNHYTQSEECPPNFKKYLLHESTQTENIFRRQCRACGFLWLSQCCENFVDGIGERKLNFYGCNSNGNQLRSSDGILKISNDYVYGGSITKQKFNPVTGDSKCPIGNFQKVPVLNADLSVCLSEYVIDTDGLPHYGGIYSCMQGNIAFNASKRECSQGFSTYVMGAIEDSCLLFVCLKFDKFPAVRELPSIVLPPFFSIPLRNQTRAISNASDFDQTDATTTTISTPKNNDLTLGLSISGIGIGVLAIVFVTIVIIQNKRQRRQPNRSNDVPLECTANA